MEKSLYATAALTKLWCGIPKYRLSKKELLGLEKKIKTLPAQYPGR